MADMPSPSLPPVLAAAPYVSVFALSWIVWDHILMFNADIYFIRKLKTFDLTAFAYLLNRYVTEAGLSYVIWSKSQLNDHNGVLISWVS
ncbi:hypothetical protein EIP86_006935 [Pleurotus ostreatoroseus]|nr:hypothetical protein EIP86_006935 [Pleurotus ostreatoroseus]